MVLTVSIIPWSHIVSKVINSSTVPTLRSIRARLSRSPVPWINRNHLEKNLVQQCLPSHDDIATKPQKSIIGDSCLWADAYIVSTSVTLLIQTHVPFVATSVRPIQNPFCHHKPVLPLCLGKLLLMSCCKKAKTGVHTSRAYFKFFLIFECLCTKLINFTFAQDIFRVCVFSVISLIKEFRCKQSWFHIVLYFHAPTRRYWNSNQIISFVFVTHLLWHVIDHKQVASSNFAVCSAIEPVLFGVGLIARRKIIAGWFKKNPSWLASATVFLCCNGRKHFLS